MKLLLWLRAVKGHPVLSKKTKIRMLSIFVWINSVITIDNTIFLILGESDFLLLRHPTFNKIGPYLCIANLKRLFIQVRSDPWVSLISDINFFAKQLNHRANCWLVCVALSVSQTKMTLWCQAHKPLCNINKSKSQGVCLYGELIYDRPIYTC